MPVEENLQSLSYEEPIPVHREIRSIEALDIRESFTEGMQMVNEKSNQEHQNKARTSSARNLIGQNVEKV